METVDTVIVGAGVIGLALARQLAGEGKQVVVLEQESQPGQHLSSRNSEVIHAGLYYPPDSLKARFCLRGNTLLYDYASTKRLPHRVCGKLVVANGHDQDQALAALHDNARHSGATGIIPVSQAWLHRREPWLRASSALLSQHSGIIDSHALTRQLAEDARERGAVLAYRHLVATVDCRPRDFRLVVHSDEGRFTLACQQLLNAAGLAAVPLLRRMHGFPATAKPELQLAKGSYFQLQGASPTRRLIYPLPENGGLGIHLTVDLGGQARFGPDVEWVEKEDYNVDPARRPHFEAAIKRYWPDLDPGRLSPAYAGIRPKLFISGEPHRDFLIQEADQHGIAGLTNLLGMESPGLTAAMAVAERVCSSDGAP